MFYWSDFTQVSMWFLFLTIFINQCELFVFWVIKSVSRKWTSNFDQDKVLAFECIYILLKRAHLSPFYWNVTKNWSTFSRICICAVMWATWVLFRFTVQTKSDLIWFIFNFHFISTYQRRYIVSTTKTIKDEPKPIIAYIQKLVFSKQNIFH